MLSKMKKCWGCGKEFSLEDLIPAYTRKYCLHPDCQKQAEQYRKEIEIKRRQTKLLKYGDENYVNIKSRLLTISQRTQEQKEVIGLKVQQTKLKNYGSTNFNNREKFKITNLERYGVEYPMQNQEILEKAKLSLISKRKSNQSKAQDTMLERYGVKHALQSPDIKEKVKQTNLKKIGYEYNFKIPNFHKKFKEKNGFENVGQRNILHREEYEDRLFWEQKFVKIEKSIRYIDIEECMEYFNITNRSVIHNKLRQLGIDYKTRYKTCKTQTKLFENIKYSQKVFNDRETVEGIELDIYLPPVKLAIEYNGLMYHSQGLSEHQQFNTPDFDKLYHLNKTLKCKDQNIQLFHIFEGEDLDLWLSMIHNRLGLNKRIFARKCTIRELKSSETIEFLNENHIQGFCNSKICLGLFLKSDSVKTEYTTKVENSVNPGTLVSLMTFSNPRFNKNYEYELIRFCSLKHHNVVGAASKLWKYFLKKYNPKSVVSYANLRFSNGRIYEKLGFRLINQSDPNYFYFKDTNILESRNKYP